MAFPRAARDASHHERSESDPDGIATVHMKYP
jgi:hypothetical protein